MNSRQKSAYIDPRIIQNALIWLLDHQLIQKKGRELVLSSRGLSLVASIRDLELADAEVILTTYGANYPPLTLGVLASIAAEDPSIAA